MSLEQKFSLAFFVNLKIFSVESICRVSEPKEGVKPIIFLVIPVVTWQLDINILRVTLSENITTGIYLLELFLMLEYESFKFEIILESHAV
jgi:hypothetical protein